MWEWYFLTLKRHLIRSGTRDYWLNSKQPESRVAIFSGSETTFLIAISVWKSTTLFQIPFWSMLGYLKVLSLVLCCLFFIWTILPRCVPKTMSTDVSTCLQMTHQCMLRIRTPGHWPFIFRTQLTVSLTGFAHGHWLWTLRKLDFWSCGGKACSPISLSITLSGKTIQQVSKHKHLGLLLNSTLTWRDQVDTICSKAAPKNRPSLSPSTPSVQACPAISVFNCSEANSWVRPACLEWTFSYWQSQVRTTTATSGSSHHAESVLVNSQESNIEHDLLLSRAGLSNLSSRRRVALCMLAFDLVHCRLPPHCTHFFQTWCPTKPERSNSLRPNTSNLIRLPKPNTSLIPSLTHVFSNFSLELPSQ